MKKETKAPSGKGWKKVLLAMYENAPYAYSNKGLFDREESNLLANKCELTTTDLLLALSFLEEHKLIWYRKDELHERANRKKSFYTEEKFIQFTEKGFNTVFELEKQRKNFSLQKIMVVLTSYLVLVGVFQVTGSLFPDTKMLQGIIYLLALIAVVVITNFWMKEDEF